MSSEVYKLFDRSLLDAAKQCVRLGYKPTEFVRMVHQRGGLETARSLLHSPSVSSGFTRLWELRRLDLSLEAHILQPQWRDLFTLAERDIARKRLAEYQYVAAGDTGESPPPLAPGSEDYQAVEVDDADPGAVLALPSGRQVRPPTPIFIAPPIRDAESLLAQVRSIVGQPERNMEDAVKGLLLRLDHPVSAVRFQIGHIDVAVDGASGKTLFVFEVKRSLLNPSIRDDALRKGFDYANRTGARYVVISDSDRYEVYDRTRGLDHTTMHCGSFRLTEFRSEDVPVLDVLRSRY
ncbi:MAG: hypothetical protein K2W85_06780 [Phycisphaerales bacterium]|nr:hypothetical protein [Phycisphaerales bacterium]